MDNAPDPTYENEGEKELEDAEQESCAVEIFASASRDHGTNARGEWEAVQDEAYNGKGVVKFDDRLLACAYCVFCSCFRHIQSFVYKIYSIIISQ